MSHHHAARGRHTAAAALLRERGAQADGRARRCEHIYHLCQLASHGDRAGFRDRWESLHANEPGQRWAG
eukprot:gene1711-8225_t